MSKDDADDAITVGTLQVRLDELQTLWQTTKWRAAGFSDVDDKSEKEGGAGGESGEEAAKAAAAATAETPHLRPSKPSSPPLQSSRSYHVRASSMEVALMYTPTNGSYESVASGIPLLPHTPPTPSTSSPRVRQKAARRATLPITSERASLESLTLPLLQAHAAPAVFTCPQCNAKAVNCASRYCTQCGVQLCGG
jgi:hypothetical protein